MGYIRKEDVIRRCEAVKHLAEIRINEWRGHTTEYKEQVSCQEAFDREREMRDMIMFLNDLPDEDVVKNIHGDWILEEYQDGYYHSQCNVCRMYAPEEAALTKWNYCPHCGAEMSKTESILLPFDKDKYYVMR